MIYLFKKNSARWSIIVIVFIILVGTFYITGRKKTNNDNTNITTKNTVGTKIASNTDPSSKSSSSKDTANTKPSVTSQAASPQQSEALQDSKSQPSPKETVSPAKTASISTVAPSKKLVSPSKTTSSQKTVSTTTVDTSKKTVSPSKTVQPTSPQKYVSNNLGFSVTFPTSWKNKYTIEEDNNGLVIKFKPASNRVAGGLLFEIVKRSPDFDESMSDSIGKRYITAKEVTYIIGGPMDVGFPPNHPEYNIYRQLASELSAVSLTIKSIN